MNQIKCECKISVHKEGCENSAYALFLRIDGTKAYLCSDCDLSSDRLIEYIKEESENAI